MKIVDLLGKKSVKRAVSAALAVLTALPLGACGAPNNALRANSENNAKSGKINVVTTTGVLRDMVANVAGDAANVSAIVPDNADPHSYEPRLRSIRDVVYADVAFSNYMILRSTA